MDTTDADLAEFDAPPEEVGSDADADAVLARIGVLARRIRDDKATAAARIDVATRWVTARIATYQAEIDEHAAALRRWLVARAKAGQTRRLSLPSGTVGIAEPTRPAATITNDEALVEWAKANCPAALKTTVGVRELGADVTWKKAPPAEGDSPAVVRWVAVHTATGEVVPGIEGTTADWSLTLAPRLDEG